MSMQSKIHIGAYIEIVTNEIQWSRTVHWCSTCMHEFPLEMQFCGQCDEKLIERELHFCKFPSLIQLLDEHEGLEDFEDELSELTLDTPVVTDGRRIYAVTNIARRRLVDTVGKSYSGVKDLTDIVPTQYIQSFYANHLEYITLLTSWKDAGIISSFSIKFGVLWHYA